MKAHYLNRWRLQFGIGVPTTIVYQIINGYEELDEEQLHAHFILEGLNIAVVINNHCIHLFYAHAVLHASSVPLITYYREGQCMVRMKNQEQNRLFAFGKASK